MYTKLPESYYINNLSNSEAVLIGSVLLVVLLISFIYHLSKINKINIVTNYNKKELSKLDVSNRKKAKRYYKLIDMRNKEDMTVHKFGLVMTIIMFIVILFSGVYQYNKPNLTNYIEDIENIEKIKIDPNDFQIYVNVEDNRIDIFKVKDTYYKKINNKYIEIDEPEFITKDS